MIRIAPDDFRTLPLEVHSFLQGVPLHDVSAIDLPATEHDFTLQDLREKMKSVDVTKSNALVSALFGLRFLLGKLLGWDNNSGQREPESYMERITAGHREQSSVAPGTMEGAFRLLYIFSNESLSEIRNATVHAFLSNALLPTESGYRFYWAVYVKPVSWITPVYMSVIDPFRRLIVYPAMLERLRKEWISMQGIS
jgi:hypothetical protein